MDLTWAHPVVQRGIQIGVAVSAVAAVWFAVWSGVSVWRDFRVGK